MLNEFALPSTHGLHLKKLLAMDFGEKFIGVALYSVNRDPYPTPFGRIANKSNAFVISELKKIIDDECVDVIIIGTPRLIDGKKTSMTTKAETFIALIREHFTLPIKEQDETLSTYEAESRMKSSPQYNFKIDLQQIDAVAACVILEDFTRRAKLDPEL